jgi:aminoglycoside 6-adenylyltransferase
MSESVDEIATAAGSYAELERRFVDWAQGQAALRAAVVVGSRARAEPVHPLSDLDLVVFTTMPEVYAATSDWLSALGPLWLAVRNDTGGGDPEWLAIYAGGLKADFVLVATAEAASLPDRMRATPYRNVYRRGVRTLFNRGGASDLPDELLQTPLRQPDPPTPAQFTAAVHAAWYAADRAARMLARGDLWRAKQQVDGSLKQALLQMLAWHSRSMPGKTSATWDDGRYLGEWAEPAAVQEIPDTFAAYEAGDMWRALFATLALYQRLAREAAAKLGYAYSGNTEAALLNWLHRVEEAR